MSWRIRIALCLVVIVGVALAVPLTRVPAGDVCLPPVDRCGYTCRARLKKKVPAVLLVNSRKIRLNYNITDVGPSGVSAVELWATRDGTTWQRYSNEPPPEGPLVVHVAEEGKYGFSLVVKNGLGMSSTAPCTGDAPQLWVEVDETAPNVQVTQCALGQGSESGCLVIGWTVNDPGLADQPISISTAVSREGPWTKVASALPNTGQYVWQMPKNDMPFEFYVKVEAIDRAGNVGSDHTPRPVKVDLVQPRGTITGVESGVKAEVKSEVPPHVFHFMPGLVR